MIGEVRKIFYKLKKAKEYCGTMYVHSMQHCWECVNGDIRTRVCFGSLYTPSPLARAPNPDKQLLSQVCARYDGAVETLDG